MSTPTTETSNPYNKPPTSLSYSTSRESDEGTLSNGLDRFGKPFAAQGHPTTAQHLPETGIGEDDNHFDDDLALLQAEQVISQSRTRDSTDLRRSMSANLSRSRSRPEPADSFDVDTNPIHQRANALRPIDNPTGKVARALRRVHDSSFLVRYFCYIVPIVAIILIPLLLGALVFKKANVGGVELMWFCVWLEIVWLTLWAGRILAKALPWPIGIVSSLFTNNSKKWRDMGKQLEIPATIFFWMLAVLVSFLPSMTRHHLSGGRETQPWQITMNKVIVSIFVGVVLNFIEKIIIQLIAISFHLRTYADRIDVNKFQIGSLTKLYQYSKEKIAMQDSDFEDHNTTGPGSGTRTPKAVLNEAQKKTKSVFGKVGDVAGKVAGDFTGRAVTKSTHPRQLVLLLLSSPAQSQILARRLYRTFVQDDAETITADNLKHAFDNEEEAESSFAMFDKDLNGDISMTELEAVCVDIGKERRSITASLKDLDSVVAKLDAVLSFFVLIATTLVLLSLISTSAAGVLTSAGSAVLALSWLFSTTAQEFLASCIFVLVKHPFDVGDRVTIYGNTGASMKGDDYMVKEISLLYTEFKKLEGQIVQAPNSYLNTLFILNMRRSGGLAEGVPLTVKFGTTLEQIDSLRLKLLDFVKEEKREYQPNILTEIREVVEAYSVNLNVVFFYKSNWQNELLRLQRRNKFICALMITMQDVGIEGPRRRIPGSKEDNPFYYASAPVYVPADGARATDSTSDSLGEVTSTEPPFASPSLEPTRIRSILRGARSSQPRRGESLSQLSRRVDFSLGMKDISSADIMADLSDLRQTDDIGSVSRLREGRNMLTPDDDESRLQQSKSYGSSVDEQSFSGQRILRQSSSVQRSRTGSSRKDSASSSRPRFLSRAFSRKNTAKDEEEGFILPDFKGIPEESPSTSAQFARLDGSGMHQPKSG